jgi:hypothetical protein
MDGHVVLELRRVGERRAEDEPVADMEVAEAERTAEDITGDATTRVSEKNDAGHGDSGLR